MVNRENNMSIELVIYELKERLLSRERNTSTEMIICKQKIKSVSRYFSLLTEKNLAIPKRFVAHRITFK